MYREAKYHSREFKAAYTVWDKIQSGEFDDWLDYIAWAIRIRKEDLRRNGKHEAGNGEN